MSWSKPSRSLWQQVGARCSHHGRQCGDRQDHGSATDQDVAARWLPENERTTSGMRRGLRQVEAGTQVGRTSVSVPTSPDVNSSHSVSVHHSASSPSQVSPWARHETTAAREREVLDRRVTDERRRGGRARPPLPLIGRSGNSATPLRQSRVTPSGYRTEFSRRCDARARSSALPESEAGHGRRRTAGLCSRSGTISRNHSAISACSCSTALYRPAVAREFRVP